MWLIRILALIRFAELLKITVLELSIADSQGTTTTQCTVATTDRNLSLRILQYVCISCETAKDLPNYLCRGGRVEYPIQPLNAKARILPIAYKSLPCTLASRLASTIRRTKSSPDARTGSASRTAQPKNLPKSTEAFYRRTSNTKNPD